MNDVCHCASCGAAFVPSNAQVGQRKRGNVNLYCSPGCYDDAKRKRMSEFWRSAAGKAYAAARYLAKKAKVKP
jgi:hypothetical protein